MTDIVDIGLKVDSRSVDSGADSLDKFGKRATKAESATAKFSRAAKVGIAAAMALATAAIWKTIDAHREFTKSISELSSITGAMGEDLKFYKDQALLLGSSTTFAASEVATAFKLVASAKPDLLESKEALAAVTQEVLTLAEASGMQLPEAATALGGALNQFGAGAESASRFINVLAAGSKFGASEINQTAEAMKNAGSVASSLGLSFEQTNAAIQSLAAVSIKGAEAGTGLRGVLLKLSTQSRDEFNPEIMGLEQALKNLSDANLTTAEKSKIFGQESITAATALINQADAVGELTAKLTGTNTATEQASINVNNLDGDVKAMSSSWEGVALLLGDTFDPALRLTVQLMTVLGKAGQSLVIAFKDIGNMLGAYAAAAGAVMSLDFEMAGQIMDMREEEAQATQDKLNGIWAEKSAAELAIEAAKKQAETKKLIAEEEKDREEKREAARIASEQRKADADAIEQERLQAKVQKFIEDDEKEFQRNEELRQRKEQAEQDYWTRLFNMQTGSQEAAGKFSIAMRDMDYKSALKHSSLALSNAAKQSRAMFNIQKAASLANMAVQIPAAVTKTLEAYPYPWNLVPAGLVLAQGLAQMKAVTSTSFGGGASVPSVGGGSPSIPVASGLPPGSTATPEGLEAGSQPVRELRVSIEGDGVHSEGMRQFARNLAETIKDMGGTDNLVIS